MEKYESLEIEIIGFDEKDVILTSIHTTPIHGFTSSRFRLSEKTLFSYEWFLDEDEDGEDD